MYIKRFITILVDGLLPPLVLDGGDGQRGSSGRLPHLFRLQILVFHPNVLSQPLLRGCHIVTLVTLGFNSSRVTGSRRYRLLLFLRRVLISSLGISAESRGAWLLLLDHLVHHCLAPGVQGEGEGGAYGDGEVEDLTLTCQRLAEFQALGEQGCVNIFLASHNALELEYRMLLYSVSVVCCDSRHLLIVPVCSGCHYHFDHHMSS